jgi:hypothetical protein
MVIANKIEASFWDLYPWNSEIKLIVFVECNFLKMNVLSPYSILHSIKKIKKVGNPYNRQSWYEVRRIQLMQPERATLRCAV